jgi:hypothetical protein
VRAQASDWNKGCQGRPLASHPARPRSSLSCCPRPESVKPPHSAASSPSSAYIAVLQASAAHPSHHALLSLPRCDQAGDQVDLVDRGLPTGSEALIIFDRLKHLYIPSHTAPGHLVARHPSRVQCTCRNITTSHIAISPPWPLELEKPSLSSTSRARS